MNRLFKKILSLSIILVIFVSLTTGCSQDFMKEIESIFNGFISILEPTENPTTQTENPENDEIVESGIYTDPDLVAAYINKFGKLPSNFIKKSEAEALGWDSSTGNLNKIAPGKSIGGDYFGNFEKKLPTAKGRKYTECDVNYVSGYRGAERLVFSNDGLIYYTKDHYETFTLLYENGVKINEINDSGSGNK